MKLYNTLTRRIEEFKPLHPPVVTFYTCGPTVYDFTHIGHMRTFVNSDVLKRTLNFLGYRVKHVMNVTDVGHLSGDDDSGEDKMEKGAKKYGKTVWEVAKFYTDFFLNTIHQLNIIDPDILSKATEHIPEMIELNKKLIINGFAYETDEALYFDVTKFERYGELSGQKLSAKLQGVRNEVYIDSKKKHPADFALWFKRVGRFSNHTMHWPSPWGDGFPGWHIECSAMSMKYLGETIDIHAGGIDHISVHHPNEIAQSEAATGKHFVRYWFHNNFMTIGGEKMSKSLNNFYTLDDILKKNIDPISLRLLFLQTHYRQPINFTWESAQSTEVAFNKLKDIVKALREQKSRTELSNEKLSKIDEFRQRFIDAISNDLQTPQAVAVMWEMLKSTIPSTDKLDLLFEFDQVFGLKLSETVEEKIPQEVFVLGQERERARLSKDFIRADELRKEIGKKGYRIEDIQGGYRIIR